MLLFGSPSIFPAMYIDLKPENLLLADKVDDTSVMLADFGFARYVPDDGLKTRCGTVSLSFVCQGQGVLLGFDTFVSHAILVFLAIAGLRRPRGAGSQLSLQRECRYVVGGLSFIHASWWYVFLIERNFDVLEGDAFSSPERIVFCLQGIPRSRIKITKDCSGRLEGLISLFMRCIGRYIFFVD